MHIVIIGLGLIGGSLALAFRETLGKSAYLIGCARRPEVAARALQGKLVDRVELDPSVAVGKADVVIISTPILTTRVILEQIGGCLSPGSIVTDTASTKAKVMEWARLYLPPEVSFIGGHPMAGKELSGLEAAEAQLFHGCTYCLTPAQNVKLRDIEVVVDLVKAVGARPLFIDPAKHDTLVAGISHLPLLLSAALVRVTNQSPAWTDMAQLAATGYRDVTRLASGSPGMSLDICLTNREALLTWIDRFVEELKSFRSYIELGEENLEGVFVQAKKERDTWLQGKSQSIPE